MNPQIKPTLQALLVADRIYTDQATNKKIVAGIFHTLGFINKEEFKAEVERRQRQVPILPSGYSAGSPFAYVSLTDVRGEQDFVLRYVDRADDKVFFQIELRVKCQDPLASVEMAVPLPPLPTVSPGVFAMELLWKEEPLGTFRIQVQNMKMESRDDLHG